MFEPKNWMTDAAHRASQTTIATHALKFTPPSAKGSNVLAFSSGNKSCYLSTDALVECCSDAVGNAATLDVAKLLQLEVEGKTLTSSLASGEYSILDPLADKEKQRVGRRSIKSFNYFNTIKPHLSQTAILPRCQQ